VIADGPVQVIVAQADCDNGFLIAANSAPAADCGEVVFEGCLATGSYYFIVAPFNFTGEDCPGLTYNAELTCGTCVSPFCGDGNVDAGEECDDGNGLGGDGCDVFCQNEPFCGDGTVDPGETCDDGNVTPGDGCDENCQLEPICDPLKTPENEPDCGAVFSGGPDTVNGGCNSAPPVYSPIACGDEICGTMGQDATGFGLRDTDWYELIVTGATQITLDVTSQFNSVFGVVNTGGSGNCADATAIDPVAFGTPNTPASMSTILGPGTWWLFVSTVDVVDIPCGAEYTMSLTCAPPPAPPVNDDCADRIAIGDGATSYSTLLATTDGPAIDCAPNGVGDVHNDIWFNYTASCTGVLAVTTCEELGGSANFDTKIAIHDGTDCSDTAASLIACNDDDPVNPCGGGGGGFHSTVTAAVTSGNVYKIRLGAFSAAQFGGGVLNISCGSVCGNGALEAGEECDDGNLINGDGCSDLCEIEPPANDNCADRTAIGDGVTSFTTLEATTDGPDYTPAADCGAFGDDSIGNDIWFNYVATCTGTLTATTCEELGGSADFDTRIAIHDGTACSGLLGTVLVCNDDDPVNACGTGGGGFHSTATAAVTSGQIYKIRLGGFSDFDSGSGGLLIGCAAGPSPTPPASTPAAHRASAKSVDAVQLSLVPSQRTAQAGSLISVDVFASGLTGARGYQIALDVAADRLAQAELVGIEINQAHSSYAFGNHEAYGAVDLEKGRAANALVSGFAKSAGQVYLATFTYRVLPGSTGALAFVIDESDTFVAGGHSAVAPLKSGGARVVITQPAKGR
jgi:cysteine-rich repeat protein